MTKLMKMVLMAAVLATGTMASTLTQELGGIVTLNGEDKVITPGHTVKVANDARISNYVLISKDPDSAASGDCIIQGPTGADESATWVNKIGFTQDNEVYQLSEFGCIDESSVTVKNLMPTTEDSLTTKIGSSTTANLTFTHNKQRIKYDDNTITLKSEVSAIYSKVVDVEIKEDISTLDGEKIGGYTGTTYINGTVGLNVADCMKPNFTLNEGSKLTINNGSDSRFTGVIDASKGTLVILHNGLTLSGKVIF